MKIEVTGQKEIAKKLKRLEEKMQKSIIRKGLKAGAAVTMAQAKNDAPVRSGMTRDSLKIKANPKRKKGIISVCVALANKAFTGCTYYAAFVLYGHHVGNRRLGSNRQWVPGNDWLGRAAKATAKQAADTAIEKTLTLLQEELKK